MSGGGAANYRAGEFASGEAASEIPACRILHQSSHGNATRVHGFATKTKPLARQIPPATQAMFWYNLCSPILYLRYDYRPLPLQDCRFICVYVSVLFVFRVGADVDVSIEDVSLSGRVQIVFEMDHLVPFPHMKSVSVTFLEK